MKNKILFKEITYQNPLGLLSVLPEDENFIFFDSAAISTTNYFSFLAYDPFSIISVVDGLYHFNNKPIDIPILKFLQDILFDYQLPQHNYFPFTGGMAGYIGYEFINCLEEKIKLPTQGAQAFPNLLFGLFDLVIVFDHKNQKSWIVSNGFPEKNGFYQSIRARERLQKALKLLKKIPNNNQLLNRNDFKIAPEEINSNFSFSEYCVALDKVKGFIRAGDIYQANIAQKFSCHLSPEFKPLWLYEQLRTQNPAPFASFVNLNGCVLSSASPERFLQVRNHKVLTCPIKGTIKRSSNSNQDEQLAKLLKSSPKDQCENVMIVDLMRNDLSRVCELNSVKVPRLFNVESFQNVHHLVSTIEGTLKKELTAIDLIAATFPGGSITGAPKLRAIEIISAIEPDIRGPYCGSIGYIGFDGSMDSSITIRTFAINNNILTFHAGGGIVADSNPQNEYMETLIKAEGLYKTLSGHSIIEQHRHYF